MSRDRTIGFWPSMNGRLVSAIVSSAHVSGAPVFESTDAKSKTPEQKQVLEIVYAQGLFTRPYFMAPDVPRDRVDAMRNAFAQMVMDREFLAEADKQKLIISPMSGVELESIIRKIYATPLPVIEKVRSAVLYSRTLSL